MTDILFPEGRIVGGHPMKKNPVTKTNEAGVVVPVMQADGVTPATESYVGFAILKGQETDWKQTPWGQLIVSAAQAGWPKGEFNAATFAWKVIDGDSQIPNKKGKKPCEREGYPGHWIINGSTRLNVKCFHVGQYDPMQQIQDVNEINPGDYGRLVVQAKANNPSKSPGVYLNPTLFELTRKGPYIDLSGGPSAAEMFGGSQSAANQQTLPQTPVAPGINQIPPVQTPVAPAPAPDFLTPPTPTAPAPSTPAPSYNVNGTVCTKEQLIAAGWTEEQMAPYLTDIPH